MNYFQTAWNLEGIIRTIKMYATNNKAALKEAIKDAPINENDVRSYITCVTSEDSSCWPNSHIFCIMHCIIASLVNKTEIQLVDTDNELVININPKKSLLHSQLMTLMV